MTVKHHECTQAAHSRSTCKHVQRSASCFQGTGIAGSKALVGYPGLSFFEPSRQSSFQAAAMLEELDDFSQSLDEQNSLLTGKSVGKFLGI